MTTGLQLALLGGALLGLGLALLVLRLLPADPDPADVVRRYTTDARPAAAAPAQTGLEDRLGLWAMRRFPPAWWGRTPTRELALLRIPLHRFYGRKLLFAATGLVAAPLLSYFAVVLGWPVPPAVPVAGSAVLAVVMFLLPDADVRADAAAARAEFARGLAAYVDMVALERLVGSGTRQAMERAAAVGDSWVFQRLQEELARSRWSGVAPWDALAGLADELGLPELADVADILRLNREGAQLYDSLCQRAEAMRSAMLNQELAKANVAGERMHIPASMLGVVFMAILVAPPVLRMMGG